MKRTGSKEIVSLTEVKVEKQCKKILLVQNVTMPTSKVNEEELFSLNI